MDDETRILIDAGHRERRCGRLAEAQHQYHRAAGHARRYEDEEGLAAALRHVADCARELDEAAESLIVAEEAVALYRALQTADGSHALDLANALRLVALALEASGHEAKGQWREALGLYRESGASEGVAECEGRLRD